MCRQGAAQEDEGSERHELADVMRDFGPELSELTLDQARVVRDIARCRTPDLGGQVHECDQCGHREFVFKSCCNRHCPKCQSLKQARWIQARQAELLPVSYFHVVFTIPSVLRSVFRANSRVCLNLLFAAVSETLQEVALNPARLGARIGFTAVLHTWTQKLCYHPHVHCIVAGGGINADGTQWVSSKRRFFLPVRILSTVFRGKLLDKLERAQHKGELRQPKSLPDRWLQDAAKKKWVIYSKHPFAGPEQVLSYLGGYTHRIAFSNHRLVALRGRLVTFRWKDRSDGNKTKLLTLDAVDFLRRFLLHVMPRGFMKIRHYGFLANSVRRESIALCRKLLAVDEQETDTAAENAPTGETWQELLQRLTGTDVTLCPTCKVGHLVPRDWIRPTGGKWSILGRATSP